MLLKDFKKILLLAGLTIAPTVYAQEDSGGLFVEPGLTYSMYDSSINYPAPFDDSSGEVRGIGLMARLGFHINEAIFVAGDARYSMPKFTDSTNDLDSKAKGYDIGPSVGMQMPDIGLRIWGTYILASELDPEASNGFDYKFTGGKGYRIGAGFRLAMVSLNLEWQKIKYDSTDIEQIGPLSGAGSTDSISFDGDGWIASVSFPLEL